MLPTQRQMEALVEFLEKNPEIAKGNLRSSTNISAAKNKWQEFSNYINSLGGAQKDGPSWSKFLAYKKGSLKKLLSRSKTGGGGPTYYLNKISPIEKRLLAACGMLFPTSHGQLTIHLIHNENMDRQRSPAASATGQENEIHIIEDTQDTSPPPLPSNSLPRQRSRPNLRERSQVLQQHTNSKSTIQRRESQGPFPSTSRSQLQLQKDHRIEMEATTVNNMAVNASDINRQADVMCQSLAKNTAAITAALNGLADAVYAMSQAIEGCGTHVEQLP